MPRPRTLPLDDALLSIEEASALCKVSDSRWTDYVKRYPALLRGQRLVQINPGNRGTMRWLKSALIEHIHTELPSEREAKE